MPCVLKLDPLWTMLAAACMAAALAGCSTVSADRMDELWREVRAQYPQARASAPKVVWTDRELMLLRDGKRQWCYGAYVGATNTVYLRRDWAGEDTVEHEFRHACGDSLGEVSGNLTLCYNDTVTPVSVATGRKLRDKKGRNCGMDDGIVKKKKHNCGMQTDIVIRKGWTGIKKGPMSPATREKGRKV